MSKYLFFLFYKYLNRSCNKSYTPTLVGASDPNPPFIMDPSPISDSTPVLTLIFTPPLNEIPSLSPPSVGGGAQRAAGKRTCGAREGLLSSGLGSPGRPGGTRGWRQRPQGDLPSRAKPAPRQGGRQRSFPASLPPSPAMARKLGQELSPPAGGWAGEGLHCSFPQTSGPSLGSGGGEAVDRDPWALPPHPTSQTGDSELKDPGSAPLDSAQTYAHPGTAGTSPHEPLTLEAASCGPPLFRPFPPRCESPTTSTADS